MATRAVSSSASRDRTARSTADVVFVHGFAADRLSWVATTAAVDAGRTLLLDLPGHGRSNHPARTAQALVEWLLEVLEQRVCGPCHVVGHSLGGGLALRAAAQRPELFRSLFLLAPVGLGREVSSGFIGRYPAVRDVDEMRELLVTLVARPSLISRQTVAYALAQLDAAGRREALGDIAAGLLSADESVTRASARTVTEAGLARHVVWGADDVINPLDRSALTGFGPNTVLEETGHLPHAERAAEVSRLLASFIEATDSAKPPR